MQKFLRAILAASGATFYVAPVWAQEAAEKGLPQFDTALFAGQLFWLVLSFGLLYALMAFVAFPRVQGTQDKRKAAIAAELAAATEASEAAKATMAQYEKALADARATAQTTVNDIVAKAAQESATRQASQQQELNKRLQEAETKIAVARDTALRSVQGASADLANLIVEKIMGSKASL